MIELSWWAGVLISLFCVFVGICLGGAGERMSWVMRAWKPGSHGAHHVEGKFYYIIEESYFVEHYRARDPFPNVPK